MVGPPADHPLDHVGPRVRREVDVGVGRAPAEERVPDRPPTRKHSCPAAASRSASSRVAAPDSKYGRSLSGRSIPFILVCHSAGSPLVRRVYRPRMDSPETWRWIWLGVAAGGALGELAIPGTFFVLSFAFGAALAAAVAFVDGELGLQWGVFVVGSGGALAALVPLGRRLAHPTSDEAQEGATRWVGRVGIVLEEIPAAPHATGRVRIERDEWRAETDAGLRIAAGAEVEVLAVRGTRLVVALTSPS